MTIDLQKSSYRLFLFILIIYPYVFAINLIAPHTLPLGKNTYISMITLMLAVLFMINWRTVSRAIPMWTILSLVFLTLMIPFLNYLFYGGVKDLAVFRFPLNVLVYLGVAYAFSADDSKKKTIYNVILYNAVIQAAVGIIHYFYFPYIETGCGDQPYRIFDPASYESPPHERGLLINPNVFSLFLLIGCFLLTFREQAFKKNSLIELGLFLLLLYGIVLSGSRTGVILGVLLFIVFLVKSTFREKAIVAIGLTLIVLLFYPFIENRIMSPFHKSYSSNDDAVGISITRSSRYVNALNLLTSDPVGFLIGTSREKTVEHKIMRGFSFSDNSFLLLGLHYGFPVAFMMLIALSSVVISLIDFKKSGILLFFIYLLISLFLYNSILFDIWLFYFSASLMLLGRKSLSPMPSRGSISFRLPAFSSTRN